MVVKFMHSHIVLGPSVSSSWVRSICQTIRGYNVDPATLLQQAQIDPSLLHIPEARYPIESVRTLWELIIQHTGDKLIGFRVGKEIQAASLHGLGLAMMASSCLTQLLELISTYCKIISTTMSVKIETEQNYTKVLISTLEGCEPKHSACLSLLTFIYRQSCQLVQHPVIPKFVNLTITDQIAKNDINKLDTYFNRSVNLGAEVDAICFNYSDLIEPYASSNPELLKLNEQLAIEYLTKINNNDICNAVAAQINHILPHHVPTLDQVAANLNLSPRTLQRKLKLANSSFDFLLDNTKKQLAGDLLAHSEDNITEIGFLLGFSDASNFNRACQRWFNCSPTQYRHMHNQFIT